MSVIEIRSYKEKVLARSTICNFQISIESHQAAPTENLLTLRNELCIKLKAPRGFSQQYVVTSNGHLERSSKYALKTTAKN